jgi:hypothetical protein
MPRTVQLKSLDIKAIEDTIADAVSQLIGRRFDCEISHVSYKGIDSVDLNMSLRADVSDFLAKIADNRSAR